MLELILISAYVILAILLKFTINPPYRYRDFNLLERIANILLIPFMEITSGGKDSHWWDWENFTPGTDLPTAKIISYDTGVPKRRKFKRYPIVGQYNLSGARDLFLTIFVLPQTVVLQPLNYHGDWILLSKGGHDFDHDPKYEWMRCRFIANGPVKYLAEGKQHYLGMTTTGEYLELEVVSVISRYQHREYLFV